MYIACQTVYNLERARCASRTRSGNVRAGA